MSDRNASKKKKVLIPLCIVFSILYIIFAITRLTTELCFVPVWTVDASRATAVGEVPEALEGRDPSATTDSTESTDSPTKLPFVLGQTLGYFDENAVVYSAKTFPFKATITENSYCIYASSSTKEKMRIFDENDNETGSIESPGFPYFTENGNFLFLPGGSSFSKLDENGKKAWTFEGYCPITAFSTSKGGVIIGTSDGTIYVFDSITGEIRQSFLPGGSETPAIFGCDISDDGKYFACLTGLNRQRFVIVKEKKGHAEIIFHKFLSTQAKRQTIVKFNEASNVVYYDFEGGMGIVDLKSLKDSTLPVKGRIRKIIESDTKNFVFVLSNEFIERANEDETTTIKEQFTVSVLEPFDSVAGSFTFEADNAFIAVKGKMLFVGRDTEITRIDIEKM